MQLDWTDAAANDLARILDYIAYDNVAAALHIKQQIDRSIRVALEYPLGFRAGRVDGTREIIAHPNYIVVYRALPSRVEIVAVLHARRQYP